MFFPWLSKNMLSVGFQFLSQNLNRMLMLGGYSDWTSNSITNLSRGLLKTGMSSGFAGLNVFKLLITTSCEKEKLKEKISNRKNNFFKMYP